MLLCCLRRDVEVSCHTLRRRLPPLTNNCAAYQRPVSSTLHGPSQLSVLHRRSNGSQHAIFWSQILAQNCHFCLLSLHSTLPLRRFPSEYCHDVWYRKLEWRGYPTVKKIEDIFISFDRIHERNRQTDTQTQTPHDGMSRACIVSRDKS